MKFIIFAAACCTLASAQASAQSPSPVAPTAQSQAAPKAKAIFSGVDFSGVYDCTGNDHKEGPYTCVVTLALVAGQSTGRYGAYSFKLEVPGYGAYPGQAAANGLDMAIHFANVDPSTKDYGTWLARFKKNKAGKWTFHKYYFEPQFKGGNHGTEDCVRR